MATHTFYLTDTAASTPGWYGVLQDGGTAPTTGRVNGLMNTGKLAVGSFQWAQVAGNTALNSNNGTQGTTSRIDSLTGPTAGTGNSTATVLGDCWASPATLTGTFAAGTWTINCSTIAQSGGAQGRFRMRIWRGTNASGAGATEVTSGALIGSTGGVSSTTTAVSSAISWSAPSFTVTAEYLFFQPEWQEQTSAGTASTAKITSQIGSGTTGTNITTTDLSLGAPFMFPRSKPYKRW